MSKRRRVAITVDVDSVRKSRAALELEPRIKADRKLGGYQVVKHTFLIPVETTKKLKALGNELGVSLQQIFATALDKWLLDRGATFGFKPKNGSRHV